MRKNTCPYIDSCNRCTHKTLTLEKKAPICVYSNSLKCQLYNEWLDKIKSLRKLPNDVLIDIKNTVEGYNRRWIK